MEKNSEKLINLLNDLPISKWGTADLSEFYPALNNFSRAISLVFAYSPDFEIYNESKFNNLTINNKATIKQVTEALIKFFQEENIEYMLPDQTVNENYVSAFSHKLAATRAGLGWIGKNSVFITQEFGPRVRLATFLVNIDIPIFNEPVVESNCGNCKVCVDACPQKCIKDKNWYPGIERDALFDAVKCKKLGHKMIKSLNREFSCGICVFSCPVGK